MQQTIKNAIDKVNNIKLQQPENLENQQNMNTMKFKKDNKKGITKDNIQGLILDYQRMHLKAMQDNILNGDRNLLSNFGLLFHQFSGISKDFNRDIASKITSDQIKQYIEGDKKIKTFAIEAGYNEHEVMAYINTEDNTITILNSGNGLSIEGKYINNELCYGASTYTFKDQDQLILYITEILQTTQKEDKSYQKLIIEMKDESKKNKKEVKQSLIVTQQSGGNCAFKSQDILELYIMYQNALKTGNITDIDKYIFNEDKTTSHYFDSFKEYVNHDTDKNIKINADGTEMRISALMDPSFASNAPFTQLAINFMKEKFKALKELNNTTLSLNPKESSAITNIVLDALQQRDLFFNPDVQYAEFRNKEVINNEEINEAKKIQLKIEPVYQEILHTADFFMQEPIFAFNLTEELFKQDNISFGGKKNTIKCGHHIISRNECVFSRKTKNGKNKYYIKLVGEKVIDSLKDLEVELPIDEMKESDQPKYLCLGGTNLNVLKISVEKNGDIRCVALHKPEMFGDIVNDDDDNGNVKNIISNYTENEKKLLPENKFSQEDRMAFYEQLYKYDNKRVTQGKGYVSQSNLINSLILEEEDKNIKDFTDEIMKIIDKNIKDIKDDEKLTQLGNLDLEVNREETVKDWLTQAHLTRAVMFHKKWKEKTVVKTITEEIEKGTGSRQLINLTSKLNNQELNQTIANNITQLLEKKINEMKKQIQQKLQQQYQQPLVNQQKSTTLPQINANKGVVFDETFERYFNSLFRVWVNGPNPNQISTEEQWMHKTGMSTLNTKDVTDIRSVLKRWGIPKEAIEVLIVNAQKNKKTNLITWAEIYPELEKAYKIRQFMKVVMANRWYDESEYTVQAIPAGKTEILQTKLINNEGNEVVINSLQDVLNVWYNKDAFEHDIRSNSKFKCNDFTRRDNHGVKFYDAQGAEIMYGDRLIRIAQLDAFEQGVEVLKGMPEAKQQQYNDLNRAKIYSNNSLPQQQPEQQQSNQNTKQSQQQVQQQNQNVPKHSIQHTKQQVKIDNIQQSNQNTKQLQIPLQEDKNLSDAKTRIEQIITSKESLKGSNVTFTHNNKGITIISVTGAKTGLASHLKWSELLSKDLYTKLSTTNGEKSISVKTDDLAKIATRLEKNAPIQWKNKCLNKQDKQDKQDQQSQNQTKQI